ncbi:MAG TPA: PPK2 family polyphosphate kinase [Pyrinomonadaceae bacterium]|nr:PPK2 family polyphosphate kinase [Pyrinomonadaceae bacterium]
MKHHYFIIQPGKKVRLKSYDTSFTGKFQSEEDALARMREDCETLAVLQDKLLAEGTHALLLIFQAMDGAGKDGTIKHVMSGLDPQGCTVKSFKRPADKELKHDYLWRFVQELPERGKIGIFNRSYYEEVLATRVHSERLDEQCLPPEVYRSKSLWRRRFTQINNFENYLSENGIIPVKIFLHLSKEKQRERLLERTTLIEKRWKFSLDDIEDRAYWNRYMKAYEDALTHTNTRHAPWHIVPADHRWFSALAVAELALHKLRALKLRYPHPTDEHRKELAKGKRVLKREGKRSK